MVLLWLATVVMVLPTALATTLTVSPSAGNRTSPIMFGLLFEELSYSGDGGLYAELIQNRAMQGTAFPAQTIQNVDFWHPINTATVNLDNSSPALSPALPYHLRLDIVPGTKTIVGLYNQGFFGFPVHTSYTYTASFYMRGTYNGPVVLQFASNSTGTALGNVVISVSQTNNDGWKFYTATLPVRTNAPNDNNVFQLELDPSKITGKSLYFNLVSVFPQTYKNRPNGMRSDLATAVANIGAKYLRFPGGNNLEGTSFSFFYHWDSTIGPINNRSSYPGTWGYVGTNGFGLLEQMQWCKDMGLEPILAVWAGYSLNGQVVAAADLPTWVQSAMNQLEFLMGATSTRGGALRASFDFPDPFKVNYVEIGNEDYNSAPVGSYVTYRFRMFHDAIKAQYPKINIISSVPFYQFPADKQPPAGTIMDGHPYSSAAQFVSDFNAFDQEPTTYPIMIGEFAVISDSSGNIHTESTLESATAEAIYMMGLERNADRIVGCSYAALTKHYNLEPDGPALLKHSPSSILYSYSYLMTQMHAQHYGDHTVGITSSDNLGPIYWSGTLDTTSGLHFIKMANFNGAGTTTFTVIVPGKTNTATVVILTGPAASSRNHLGSNESIYGQTSVQNRNGSYTFTLTGQYFFAVLIV